MKQGLELFEINTPTVVSEIVDGEAVMINLDTGAYYSMNESGSRIWDALRERVDVEGMIDRIAPGQAAERALIEDATREFIAKLAGENLIRLCAAARVGVASAPRVSSAELEPAAFTPPSLEKYRDLEDLLLADPIHDVTEAGWPHRKDR